MMPHASRRMSWQQQAYIVCLHPKSLKRNLSTLHTLYDLTNALYRTKGEDCQGWYFSSTLGLNEGRKDTRFFLPHYKRSGFDWSHLHLLMYIWVNDESWGVRLLPKSKREKEINNALYTMKEFFKYFSTLEFRSDKTWNCIFRISLVNRLNVQRRKLLPSLTLLLSWREFQTRQSHYSP